VDPGATHLHREERIIQESVRLGFADNGRTKLLQEVPASDPGGVLRGRSFSDRSHGFRPGRGCHNRTAGGSTTSGGERYGSSKATSATVSGLWTTRSWRSILAEKIHDGRFPAPDRRTTPGRISGRLAVPTPRSAAARKVVWFQPVFVQHLPWTGLDQYIEQTLLPVHNQGGHDARRIGRTCGCWQRALPGSNSKETATAGHAPAQADEGPCRRVIRNDPGYRRLR